MCNLFLSHYLFPPLLPFDFVSAKSYIGILANTVTPDIFSMSCADFIVVSNIFSINTYPNAITIPITANIKTSFL